MTFPIEATRLQFTKDFMLMMMVDAHKCQFKSFAWNCFLSDEHVRFFSFEKNTKHHSEVVSFQIHMFCNFLNLFSH